MAISRAIADNLAAIYADGIDDIIDYFGRLIVLSMPPIQTECNNCYVYNINGKLRSNNKYKPGGPKPFINGTVCPVCHGEGVINQVSTVQFYATVKWNPEDYAQFVGKTIEDPTTLVKIKTYRTYEQNIKNCISAVIDNNRCKLIGKPVPRGLQTSRYCVSIWQVIG